MHITERLSGSKKIRVTYIPVLYTIDVIVYLGVDANNTIEYSHAKWDIVVAKHKDGATAIVKILGGSSIGRAVLLEVRLLSSRQ